MSLFRRTRDMDADRSLYPGMTDWMVAVLGSNRHQRIEAAVLELDEVQLGNL